MFSSNSTPVRSSFPSILPGSWCCFFKVMELAREQGREESCRQPDKGDGSFNVSPGPFAHISHGSQGSNASCPCQWRGRRGTRAWEEGIEDSLGWGNAKGHSKPGCLHSD